jgi:Putative zinc-finger
MSRVMRHSEVSEVLGDYAHGRLDAPTAASVEHHLAGCAECASELKAVTVLQAEQAPLSDIERARLHRAVGETVKPAPSRQRSATHRGGWAARVAPALGAAALLALIAVGASTLLTGEGADESGGADAGGSALTEESREKGAGGKEGPEARPRKAAGADEGTADTDGQQFDGAAPDAEGLADTLEPRFQPTTAPLDEKDLARLADRTGYKSALATKVANRSMGSEGYLVGRLSNMAPKPVRDQVRTCARRVRSQREEQVFATYGTLTEVSNRPSLVLGFIWQGPPQDRPGYMLWAWPRGSCEQPLAYSASGDKP